MGFGPVSVTPGLATHMEVRGPDCKAPLKHLKSANCINVYGLSF